MIPLVDHPIRSLIATAVAGAALCGSARLARSNTVDDTEQRVFRWFNDAPDGMHGPAWALMQSGSLAGVFVTAAALARRHRTDTAVTAAVAGTAVWAGVKLVKPLVGRGRPQQHLDDVAVRGLQQSGLGYPSGHAAVSLTLALVTPAGTGLPVRAAGCAFGAAVGATRMYVGAHLPLDVVGGLAIGVLAAQTTRYVQAALR